MYRTILLATDGSAETERAEAHAVALAAAHGATLHAVYVADVASFAGLSVDASWEGVVSMLHRRGEQALERVRRRADDEGVTVETVTLEGSPSRKIVDYARRAGCDLVVMGTHGRGGIDRLLLGSVAERVVRSADVPVLTVRVGGSEETVAIGGDAEERADAPAADPAESASVEPVEDG